MNGARGRHTAGTLTLLLVLLLAGACGQKHTEPPIGDAARGQVLWTQSACATCHGASAEGAKGGPALADTPLSLRDVTGLVRRGTVNMPAFAAEQVSDKDLEDMFAWWQNPPAATDPGAGVCVDACPAPTTAAGEGPSAAPTAAIALNPWPRSPCAGCHGASAEGGIGPALKGTALSLAQFQAAVRQGRGSMPAYSAAELSDQAVQALFGAVQAPPAPAVTLPPVATAAPTATLAAPTATSEVPAVAEDPWPQSPCAGCHGASAEGGIGPALKGTAQSLAQFQATVRQGPGSMPAYSAAELSDQAVQALYHALRGQAAPASSSTGPVATSTAAVQQHPWLRVGCANCHGQRAEGGTGPTLAGEDWEFEKFRRKVREGDDGMPAFGMDQVGDADLQVIYDWLLAGAPAP